MYPVSEAYLEAINSGSVSTSYRGLITSKYGIPFYFTGADIVQGSGKVTRQICQGEDIQIGTTCSSSLDVSLYLEADRYLLYEAEIQMWFQLHLPNGTIEEVPLGTFYAIEPPERSINVLTFHAYDSMFKFEQNISGTPQGDPYNILEYICNRCGVEVGVTQEFVASCPNGLVSTYAYSDSQKATYRDMLGDLAGYLCCFAYIGVDNKLYLKRYGHDIENPDRVITASNRYEYIPMDYESYYSRITADFLVTRETESVVLDTTGLVYKFGANVFAQIDDDTVRKNILLAIISELTLVRYTPFSAKVPCDPSLMVGDVLNFQENHASDGKLSAITKQVIVIGGSMEIECTGRDPLVEMKTATEKAIEAVSYSKSDDALHYYDFVNTEVLHIVPNATRVPLFVVDFVTTKATHVDFHAQLAMDVENIEIIGDGFEYVEEYDGVVKVTYALAGEEIVDFYPIDTFFDGKHVLNLMYAFWASGNQRSDFVVYIECINCSLDIAIGHARGYMCGQGLVGDDAWDGTVHIYDDFTPYDFANARLEIEDGVNVSVHYPVGDELSQQLAVMDASSILKTIRDDVVESDLIRFTVLYNASEMYLSNARVENDVWIPQDVTELGIINTPVSNVNRILRITSKNSGSNVVYLVSFDEGTTWWTYQNGWTEPDYTQDVYGMFESTMRSITTEQWDEKLRGTLMIQTILIGSNAYLRDIQIYVSDLVDWITLEHTDVTNYNENYVTITDEAVELHYEYEYTATETSIDSGRMCVVEIDDSVLSDINNIEVNV